MVSIEIFENPDNNSPNNDVITSVKANEKYPKQGCRFIVAKENSRLYFSKGYIPKSQE